MNQIQFSTPIIALLAVSFFSAGCGKSGMTAPTPLEADKLPATVTQAFNQSAGQTRELATSYVSSFQSQDPTTAFQELQELRDQQNLNEQQRTVLARALMTTFQQLRLAAANGDKSAQLAIHKYLSTR